MDFQKLCNEQMEYVRAEIAAGLTPLELLEREIRSMAVDFELALGQDITKRSVQRRMDFLVKKTMAKALTMMKK